MGRPRMPGDMLEEATMSLPPVLERLGRIAQGAVKEAKLLRLEARKKRNISQAFRLSQAPPPMTPEQADPADPASAITQRLHRASDSG